MKSVTLFFAILLWFSSANAYDHNSVHMEINKNALTQSKAKEVIKNQLFQKGVEEYINGKAILDWIIEGGRDEDAPERRGLVHYHDPLKAWESSGLLGTFASSVLWAQNQQNVWLGDDMSWKTARTAYYEGLTATDNQIREEKLAKAFKAVGQTMHLISDMSVPAHTRDTAHPLNEPYEVWTAAHFDSLDYTATDVPQNIVNYAVTTSSAPYPISALWDMNIYNGTTVYSGGYAGLAEISNANFFSDITIFRNYPHPAKINTNATSIEVLARDGQPDTIQYIKGYMMQGESDKLAALTYLSTDLDTIGYSVGRYHLDDAVHEAYAKKLVPLAVGYSAALLDYFFRGQIELSLLGTGVYASIDDPALSGGGFKKLQVLAKNVTPNDEEMTEGSAMITYYVYFIVDEDGIWKIKHF